MILVGWVEASKRWTAVSIAVCGVIISSDYTRDGTGRQLAFAASEPQFKLAHFTGERSILSARRILWGHLAP
jgi:hypothetical protein